MGKSRAEYCFLTEFFPLWLTHEFVVVGRLRRPRSRVPGCCRPPRGAGTGCSALGSGGTCGSVPLQGAWGAPWVLCGGETGGFLLVSPTASLLRGRAVLQRHRSCARSETLRRLVVWVVRWGLWFWGGEQRGLSIMKGDVDPGWWEEGCSPPAHWGLLPRSMGSFGQRSARTCGGQAGHGFQLGLEAKV